MTRLLLLRFILFACAWLLATPAPALECPPLPGTTRALAGEIRHPHGLLWQVRAPGGARSVLLGTMHVSDDRISDVMAAARRELAASRTFVMEVVLDGAAMLALQGAMFYQDGRSLREVAGADLFERTAVAMQGYGVPPALLETMKPWAAFTTLGTPAGAQGAPLDLMLMLEAQLAGKAVAGLETVAEQIAVFESIPESRQVDMLLELACHYDVLQAEIDELVERYAARDLAGLVTLAFRHVDHNREAFLDALLWQRNALMLERMTAELDAGEAFIAVGALHLPGERGLLQGLERRGYVLEALY